MLTQSCTNKTFKFLYITLFIGLLISNISCALPDNHEFKIICRNKNDNYYATHLEKTLNRTPEKIFLNWMNSFDDFLGSPLGYAVNTANIAIIKLLIDYCIEHNISYYKFVSQTGMSLLSLAVMLGYPNVVDLLLNDYHHPVSMDNLTESKTSALHQAAIIGDVYTCRLLAKLEKKIVHCKDHKGFTPINYLMDTANECFIIELLDQYPIDKNNIPLDELGQSYLHHAVNKKLYQLVNKLLDMGFTPTQKNNKGETALFLAANQSENRALQRMLNKAQEQRDCCFLVKRLRFPFKNKSNQSPRVYYNGNNGYEHIP